MFCEHYNSELSRWQRNNAPVDVDTFVDYDKLKWSRNLKRWFRRGVNLHFEPTAIRQALFRPYIKSNLYFGRVVIDEIGDTPEFFPTVNAEAENVMICVNKSPERPFCVIAANRICSKDVAGGFGSPSQCFPFYTYDEDGANRRENIPLSTLVRFRSFYGDERITKWDIFHYVYALLHHPGYRERFASNLKRELPRIPFAPDFRAFAKAGQQLVELHINYEQVTEFPLKRMEHRDIPFTLRVEAMKLTSDKRELKYNESFRLAGIPPEVFDYKLGNRSALDWVIDQYRVSTDARSGIESDPNRPDDEGYIIRLIGQVITVSLETQRIVTALPPDYGAEGEESEHDHKLATWRLNQSLPTSASARRQMERLKVEANSHSGSALNLNETSSSYGPAKKASRSRRKST
jgi:predicted helicase